MDKDTQALTLYVPKETGKSFTRLKTFISKHLISVSVNYRNELFLFICLYIVFEFLGFCLSIKDNSIFINSDFLEFKKILVILTFNVIFSFTVFGKIVTLITVTFIGFNFGIEYYLNEFATQGGKLGSVAKIFILLVISFALLLFLLELFCFSNRAVYGKQQLFEIKPLVVHIFFICISIFLIYFLFYLYYNV